MEKVIARYNNIMMVICREYLTIGYSFSDNTGDWNLRDMVAECDYQLSTYYEVGHCNEEMRHSLDIDERNTWKREVGFLQRFIDTYSKYIDDMECTTGHCSMYD